MDNVIISMLKDYKSSIEKSFGKIEKKIKSYNKAEKNDIKQELKNIKIQKGQIEKELNNLKDEENKNEWEEIYNKFDSQYEEYHKKLNDLDSIYKNKSGEEGDEDYLDPSANVDLNKLNSQQVVDRGDKIVEANDQAIGNIEGYVNNDNEIMAGVNKSLGGQIEKFDKVDSDIKEMNFSVDRAKKKLTSMFKIYASDKCITCMIVAILIIIVVIIIVSACGGDNKNNFNVPHDIFGTNKNSTSNRGNSLIKSFNLISIISLLALYIL